MSVTGYTNSLHQSHATVMPLSGLWETAIGYGSTIPRATTHNDVVRNVYVRLNEAEWIRQGSPFVKRVYYSAELIGGIIHRHRALVVDQAIGYYNPLSPDSYLDSVRASCCSIVPSRHTTRKVLDAYHASAFGTNANVDPNFVQPPINGQPSVEAQRALEQMDAVAGANKAKTEAEQAKDDESCGFFCQLGRPFQAVGNFTTIMSYAIPTVVVVLAGSLVYVFVAKGRQFDVNRNYGELQKTIRVVGPDAAAAIVRKGK